MDRKLRFLLRDLLEAAPVFNGFFDHGGSDDDDQRKDGADGGVRRQGSEGEGGADQEVDIGHAPELFEEGFGDEGDERVFRGGDVVGGVGERFGFEGVWLVDEGPPAVASPPDL